MGSLAHRIFARHLSKGPIADDDFVQACREEIGNSNLNHKVGSLLKPSELAGVIEEVRQLYQRFSKLPGEGFDGSEVTIDHETTAGLKLVGVVDAIYKDGEGHRLVDWKTGGLGDAEEQLDFYAFLWALDREELPSLVEAVSVKTGERYSTVPSSGDVQQIAEDVSELARDMRHSWATSEELPKRGGPWCQYCPILDSCEEGQATEALLG